MTNVAIFGAAGNMGTRACRRLKAYDDYRIQYVELMPAGVEKLKARGDTPTSVEDACRTADIIVMAIADKFIPTVVKDVVPKMRSGAMLLTLDPAAAYAGALPKRDDVSYFVTHPTHPPLYNDETTDEARNDHFGAGLAKQSIVSALVQGPDADFAKGEELAKRYFSPIIRSHRLTLEQIALLEPAMAETCGATFIVALKEAMDECIRQGVPEQAAKDFMLGHINVQLAIVFEAIDWKMSDGAYLVIRNAIQRIFKPDWKDVFRREEVKTSVRKIVGME